MKTWIKEQNMKSRIILSYISLLFACALQAAPITGRQAYRNAMSFLYGSTTMRFSSAPVTLATSGVGIRPYYVFNIGSGDGFVIVSGDDAACPVLGYSRSGHFDEDNLPENMKSWLAGYADELERIQNLNLPARRSAAVTDKGWANVAPLLQSRWNQNSPYNDLCPLAPNGRTHRPTGCVATAMTQVMYYHKWPVAPTAEIPGYTYKDEAVWGGDGSLLTEEALPSTVFDWDSMLDAYDDETMYDEKSAFAVAELMRYVGHGVRMTYGIKASGAFSDDIPVALVRYFGYKNTARLIRRSDYSTQYAWDKVIYGELSARRPVIYSGVTLLGAGHQFACDGYEDGFFHINWGWAGRSDGYFKLSVLDPEDQGIGGAGSGSSFSELQTAVIGVQKDREEDMVHASDIVAEPGEQFPSDILFHNLDGSYTSLQFDLRLPSGITIAGDASGLPAAVFNQQRSQSANHTAVVNRLSDGLYRFVIYSPTNALFTGADGPVLSISINVSPAVSKGSYAASVGNVVACDSYMHTRDIRGCEFNVGIVSDKTLLGDADNNGRVDGDDVNTIMQYVMNAAPASFIFKLADVDSDGIIDVADAALTNDIILHTSGADRHIVPTDINDDDMLVVSPSARGINLKLNNTTCCKALQMDVILPAGVDITDVVPSDKRIGGFTVCSSQISGGQYRLAFYSADGRNIELGEGTLAELVTSQQVAGARISRVVVLTSDLRKTSLADVFYKVPSAIDEVTLEHRTDDRIYTLSGIRLNKPLGQLDKGIYIVNGKKTIVM